MSTNNLAIVNWKPHNRHTDLIFDDHKPLRSNRHRIAMNVLIRSLQQLWSDRNDYFTQGNMFIYYSISQVKNRNFRGSDFFAVLNVDSSNSQAGWVVWKENGPDLDMIVELMSRSTAEIDSIKKYLKNQIFRTSDYFVYNPFDPNSLQGWHLDDNQEYRSLTPNENAWFWCRHLGLWLGTWEGTIDRETATWLRFYDISGNLVLLPEEANKAQVEKVKAEAEKFKIQAENAKAKAAKLAARLRELGENPDML
ncbi:Uma2 family endonuclease [Dolichospermum flos-aquae]|uniref:Uma2 family endonuclease n=1 Tax=Dolichospermum flos-aquae LEGE 04289 TaxID=1828708 RepID=A0ACC5Q2E7_DOLFA|nr:Uma2 family endonuclease [Dolichospermum flos-aquae]MBE9219746.1 Uma2 family endonuclease [Dolichospermum flos-aquae LEGE 04289]